MLTDGRMLTRPWIKTVRRITIIILFGLFMTTQATAFALPVGLYWIETTSGKIQYSALDGSNVTTLVDGLMNPHILTIHDDSLYWVDRDLQQVFRANGDGSNVELFFDAGPKVPRDLVFTDEYIYMTTTLVDSISRINLDGSSPVTLVSEDLGFPSGLIATDEHLYWADSDTRNIRRSNLDGSDIVEQITFEGDDFLPGDLLIIDDYIYWVTRDIALTRGGDPVPGTITRSKLDGTERTVIVDNLVFPHQLKTAGDYLYWTDHYSGKLQRANLDGTNVTDILTGLDSPMGLAVVTINVPEPTTVLLFCLGIVLIFVLNSRFNSCTLFAHSKSLLLTIRKQD